MRIILDTNVIVSALIQKSYPYYIVEMLLTNKDLNLCISKELLLEYFEVLNRSKFRKFPNFHAKAEILLTDILSRSSVFKPTSKIKVISDEPDNRLLELAEVSKAEYLVTGNTNDFTMKEYKGTKIISPRECFELLSH